ncbi:hypothetical protein [Halomonas faecis]|uniref:hypothetical protein n=1 Tax=Halomonas faecis TaxID=1562110 RepID=UPI0013D8B669|nr:hypothetical protein [Halomonas faecis]
MLLSLISMLVGATITWWVARSYYEKASHDLSMEAAELKKLNTLMLRGMEEAGMAEFSRDHEGNIQGMKINMSSNIQAGSATIKCDASVMPKNSS